MSTKSVVELRKELRTSMGRVSKMSKEDVLKHLGHFSPSPAVVQSVIAEVEKKKPTALAQSPAPVKVEKKEEKKKSVAPPAAEKKKLVKGSQEMKDHMKMLREKRKPKA